MKRQLNACVSGETRVFAIIGDPIAQARSPLVFNTLFERLQVNAVMVPLHVPSATLDSAITGLKQIANLDGIVVTVPHKVALVSHVDELNPMARRIGAINCMRRGANGRWVGGMYDGEGFVAGLRAAAFDPRAKHVFQAGAGGAGKAIAHALAAGGVASLAVWDIDADHREALVAALARSYPALEVRVRGPDPGECDLAVNATPCGMSPEDAMPFRIDALPASALVAEVIMKPEETALLKAARERGLGTHPGRHMLESQAGLIAEFFGLRSACVGAAE